MVLFILRQWCWVLQNGFLLIFSEVLADESIVCLQKALTHLREIWGLIGIPEEQRLQRTEVVKKHIKVSWFTLLPLQGQQWGWTLLVGNLAGKVPTATPWYEPGPELNCQSPYLIEGIDSGAFILKYHGLVLILFKALSVKFEIMRVLILMLVDFVGFLQCFYCFVLIGSKSLSAVFSPVGSSG